MTAADLAALEPGAGRRELVRGEIIEMPPTSGGHGRQEFRVARFLDRVGEQSGLGQVLVGEVGIVVARGPDTVRGADVVFLSQEQLPVLESPEGYLLTPPALVVEVLSRNDRASDVAAKVSDYLGVGVRVVWVVDPPNRTVTVYLPEGVARVLRPGQTLWAPGVLDDLSADTGELFD